MAWYGLGCKWLTCISSGHLTGQPGNGDCYTVKRPKGRKSIYSLQYNTLPFCQLTHLYWPNKCCTLSSQMLQHTGYAHWHPHHLKGFSTLSLWYSPNTQLSQPTNIDKHPFSVGGQRSRLASEVSVCDRLIAIHYGLQASGPNVTDWLITIHSAD